MFKVGDKVKITVNSKTNLRYKYNGMTSYIIGVGGVGTGTQYRLNINRSFWFSEKRLTLVK